MTRKKSFRYAVRRLDTDLAPIPDSGGILSALLVAGNDFVRDRSTMADVTDSGYLSCVWYLHRDSSDS
jgi:hypothetical protein